MNNAETERFWRGALGILLFVCDDDLVKPRSAILLGRVYTAAKIVFEDDKSSGIWENLNLCQTDKITLSYDRKTGVTTAKRE